MYIKLRKFTGVLLCSLALVPMACQDDIDPIIEEFAVSRAFAPIGLEARVRNKIDVELSWLSDPEVQQYIVEIFQDSLSFSGDPIATATIEDIPSTGNIVYTESLTGETTYSARVKAVVEGVAESKWSAVAVMTESEQVFLPLPGENVQDTYAKVLWTPGIEVTSFLIEPGNILVQISDAQRAAGEATIEGLTGATDYTVTIYNGVNKRGFVNFSTLKQSNVSPLDDLGAAIDAAAEGATLILASGTYVLGSKEITKSITIEGQKSYDMPIIDGQLAFGATVASVTVKYLNFQGAGNYGQFANASAATCNLASFNVDGCEISGYSNNIIYNNSGGTFGDITITNTYIHDIPGGGGDGFDFRGGVVGSLTVENSTLDNGVRTLLRMQVPADVTFKNCTFYKVCNAVNSNNRGFFRMSGATGSLDVSNCLFVETGIDDNGTIYGNWSRAGDISVDVTTNYKNNYYFNTVGLFEGEYTDPSQVDATEADPVFEDPENGDFTITNQLIIDEKVGDSRWWF